MLGDIHFSDELAVSGVVKGDIIAEPGSKAKVTVYENGRVEGDIRVPNVVVNGEVEGNIFSEKHVELAAKAQIKGNVFYNLIEMVMGSKVDGNLVHAKNGDPGDNAVVKRKRSKKADLDDESMSEQNEIDLSEGDADAEEQSNVTNINS